MATINEVLELLGDVLKVQNQEIALTKNVLTVIGNLDRRVQSLEGSAETNHDELNKLQNAIGDLQKTVNRIEKRLEGNKFTLK